MPKYRESFTLYSRKLKNGKTYWYYQTYDKFGKRTSGKNTGYTSKTLARQYCEDLKEQGLLIPDKQITLNSYAKDWWIWEKCKYIKGKLLRSKKGKPKISRTYANDCLIRLNNHILPYLGKFKLTQLSPHILEDWMFTLLDKGLAPKTINHIMSVLRVMITEACRLGILKLNPFSAISPLSNDSTKRGILTLKETKKLFDERNIKTYWLDRLIYYTANLLAASTGLRQGEIRGIKTGDLFSFEDSEGKKYRGIHVYHSYGKNGLGPTKTRKNREVIYPAIVAYYIDLIKPKSGYIFSYDNGKNPCSGNRITDALYLALEKMGISPAERKERNINFHSWRHWADTYFKGKNVPKEKRMNFTGHLTAKMDDDYTNHFNPDYYKEIGIAQTSIF